MNKCLGCGILLQNQDRNKLGYVFDLKNSICERCFKLKHYGEYQKVSLNNQDFQKILSTIPKQNLVIYITDALTLDLTYINKFPNMILVITKRDILPKSVKDDKIITKIKTKYPKLLDIIMVSSIKNYQLDRLYQNIQKYHQKKSVYFIGNTNSGKSTLLNKLISNYSKIDTKTNITMSMYPSTTIDKIEVQLNEITLVDTPGLLDEGNISTYLEKKDLKKITPMKEIKPRSCQIKGKGSILIDNYARLDYETKKDNSLVIYTALNLQINFASYEKKTYRNLKPHKYSIPKKKDIVIPGLGFIKIVDEIEVTLYLPENVKPYIRDNLI